ncbi:MAG: CotH kinase family protein [Bacteroidales bacterium]|nr:CotH kinase family protein [Bacteroidales bacterium]
MFRIASVFIFVAVLIPVTSAQDIIINEFQASNFTTLADSSGEYDDWIEIFNRGNLTLNLNGYYLTDDLAAKTKSKLTAKGDEFIIAPGEYRIFWADDDTAQGSNHLNFKLSAKGEQIALISPKLFLIDSVSFGTQVYNVSMGRDTLDYRTWHYFPVPTPGSANNTEAVAGFSEEPELSEPSGFLSSPFQLSMHTSDVSDKIYHSLNTRSPDPTSILYEQPLTITDSKVVRAAAYHQNLARSNIASEIYLFNTVPSMPVIAIITDSSNLWGQTGIYTRYYNAGPEWERFCQVRYMKEGRLERSFNAGIRIQGASSISMPKKSFRLFLREQYGEEMLCFPLFGDENFASFNNLVLKSGYDDDITTSEGTLLRDALSNELWERCGGLSTQSSWAALYLNDKYWGIYNIRERINEEFIAGHTNFTDFDMVRYNWEGPELLCGSIDRWNEWFSFISERDLSDEANYAQLEQWMDMDYFINLMAFVHCTSYYSWGWGVTAFSENSPPGKWRFTTWDADRAFRRADTTMFGIKADRWADTIPKKLLNNAEYRRKFINRTCDLLNTIFLPANSIPVLESIYNTLKPDIQDEINRWNKNAHWEDNVDRVRLFLQKRPEVIKIQFPKVFSLGAWRNVHLRIQGKGTIRISTLYINEDDWTGGYFEGNTVELEAIPAKGYTFAGWNETHPGEKLSLDLHGDTTLTAVFAPDYSAVNTVMITEIAYLLPSGSTPGDWIELYNTGIRPVDISGWNLSDNNSSHTFTFPFYTVIQPEEFLVVAEIKELFLNYYPGINRKIVGDFGLGAAGFALNAAGETIVLKDAAGNLVDSVAYQNKYPWPVVMNATYGSIQVINTDVSNDDPGNWKFVPEAFVTPGDTCIKTSIPEIQSVNNSPSLYAYPNPFNVSISFNVILEKTSRVNLQVYDMSGRRIICLYNGNLSAGSHLFNWDGSLPGGLKANSGIYIVIMSTPERVIHQKIILKN